MRSTEDRERFEPLGPAKRPQTPPAPAPAESWSPVRPGIERNRDGQHRTTGDDWRKKGTPP